MRLLALLFLLSLVLPSWAVSPHNKVAVFHKATAQSLTSGQWGTVVVDTADVPYDTSLFSLSSGTITLNASGRYRVTVWANATTSVNWFLVSVNVSGATPVYPGEQGASADERGTSATYTAYYEAGMTLQLAVYATGTTPKTMGAISIQLL